MPAYQPSPASDPPVTAGNDVLAADGDQPMVGYECAMPWWQLAAPAIEPLQPPWPGSPAG
ncbi:MAG: hypothetical protein QE285_03580 [Aquabacterium sp.]|nr:hypothetical protein [Aquabacterium sp.]